MKEKLKPCPFCGGEADFCEEYSFLPRAKNLTHRGIRVYCVDCMVSTQLYWEKEEAINAWNTRVKE